MELTDPQQRWASRGRRGVSRKTLREILVNQNGLCALSQVEMIFDLDEGKPIKEGRGTHPLYPSVDHIDPGNPQGGYQIICYALNDLKGHLSPDCFNALSETGAWHSLMDKWHRQATDDRSDRDAFMRLLRPNAGE
jgi:hypothetical protein